MKRNIFDNLKLEKAIPDWKERGAVSTPENIIRLMIELAKCDKKSKILDAGCGLGNFIYILKNLGYENVIGIELNKDIIPEDLNVINDDFILYDFKDNFDLVIGNPPYGIPAVGAHYPIRIENKIKEKYKSKSETWKGKYNLYALFMEKALKITKQKGKVCFIVPSTWLLLDDFSKLRKFLSSYGRTSFYHMGKKVFKSMHVDVGIFLFHKDKKEIFDLYCISEGFHIEHVKTFPWKGERIDFSTREREGIKIKELFDICISLRSNALHKYEGNEIHYMTGKNVKNGLIDRNDYCGKKTDFEFIPKMKKEYGIVPRIVMRHTSPYPVCAVETEIYPYVGDVYHLVPKRIMNEKILKKICEYLNSEYMKKIFFEKYRSIIPHIMKWQIEECVIEKEIINNI